MTRPEKHLPELKAWNGGRGISALHYIFCYARSDTATAYIDLFWPEFALSEGHVFRAGFEEEHVRKWQTKEGVTRRNIEAALNYLDVGSLFQNSGERRSDLLEARTLLIRATLAEIYKAKLDRDFPGRTFIVELIDTDDDTALTFYQT